MAYFDGTIIWAILYENCRRDSFSFSGWKKYDKL